MNFELLREMDSFSEDMMNRIIAFQSKEHAAWNPNLSFEHRIKDLSLHDLVFSHPQRDPQQSGPTIAHYYPRREEMARIAAYARAVAPDPVVCDLHARNGFIGSLLAREGVRVLGLNDPQTKPNQIASFFDPTIYEITDGTIHNTTRSFDVAFSAWMPAGENLTPAIVLRRPKLIVFVFTEHLDTISQTPQTGTPGAYTQLPSHYKLIEEWRETRPENLFRDVWPDLTGNIAETRITRIYADTPWHDLQRTASTVPMAPYDWEKDLEMALLALEAKQFLRSRGFTV